MFWCKIRLEFGPKKKKDDERKRKKRKTDVRSLVLLLLLAYDIVQYLYYIL